MTCRVCLSQSWWKSWAWSPSKSVLLKRRKAPLSMSVSLCACFALPIYLFLCIGIANHPRRRVRRLRISPQSSPKILWQPWGHSADGSWTLVVWFSSSPFLSFDLLQRANQFESQAAVVRGAALRGLEGTAPTSKQCRRHYGFEWAIEFRDGIDKEENAYTDSFDQTKYVEGIVNWVIAKVRALLRDASN